MRTHGVVVPSPGFDNDPGLVERVEDFPFEQFEAPGDRYDLKILFRCLLVLILGATADGHCQLLIVGTVQIYAFSSKQK